jgi:hypothetical protein
MADIESNPLGLFGRYLSLWVALCIGAGVGLGALFPGAFEAIAGFEIARVNLVVAVFIWVMIYPMMVQVDLGCLRDVGKRPGGLALTLVVNWLIKPFTMALLAWLFFKGLFADLVPAEDASQYIAGMILLGVAPCTAMVFVWSQLSTRERAALRSQVREWSPAGRPAKDQSADDRNIAADDLGAVVRGHHAPGFDPRVVRVARRPQHRLLARVQAPGVGGPQGHARARLGIERGEVPHSEHVFGWELRRQGSGRRRGEVQRISVERQLDRRGIHRQPEARVNLHLTSPHHLGGVAQGGHRHISFEGRFFSWLQVRDHEHVGPLGRVVAQDGEVQGVAVRLDVVEDEGAVRAGVCEATHAVAQRRPDAFGGTRVWPQDPAAQRGQVNFGVGGVLRGAT